MSLFNKAIKKNQKKFNSKVIFLFLVLNQQLPSSEFGYFLTKKIKGNINKVSRFVEKPKKSKAKQIIRKKGYWNSGMFYLEKRFNHQ